MKSVLHLTTYLLVSILGAGFAAWLTGSLTTRALSQDSVPVATQPAPSVSPAQPSTPTPQVSVAMTPAPSPVEAANADDQPVKVPDVLVGIIEEYDFSPEGKRDPFMPLNAEFSASEGEFVGPIFPLQKFDVDQLRLIGIIWNVKSPKALIVDPTGKGYIVKVQERVGRNNGYIARIREGELVIVESIRDAEGKLRYQTKLLKIANKNEVPQ